MTTKLASAAFPLDEVLQLRSSVQKVYRALWNSAVKDDIGPWGGTTHWSIKGLSASTGSTRETVSKALAELLDSGLITALGLIPCSGTNKTVWRVIHPEQIEAQRAAIAVIGKPSVRWKQAMKPSKANTVQPDNFVGWIAYRNALDVVDAPEENRTQMQLLKDAGFQCKVKPVGVRETYGHLYERQLDLEVELAMQV